MRRREYKWPCIFLASLSLAAANLSGCSEKAAENAATESSHQMLSDASSGENWPAFGRTYGEQHFSPLAQINRKTVEDLELTWYFDLGSGNSVTGPLQVNGIVYFASGYSDVHALDSTTGNLLWRHDTQAAQAAGHKLRQGWGSRGLAWWNQKVFTGTQDGRLVAIDALTGEEAWSVMTVEPDDGRFISGPPRAFKGMVIVGHGGADASDVRGYVTAYDAESGEMMWRFYTVPGDPANGFESDAMKMAASTWSGEWWEYGGGGTVWNAITYDEELDQVYIGTGNGAPWNHKIRSEGKGDNLFLSSVVALDANTGEYVWHYQTNPGESWDYNASMDMQLAEIRTDGDLRKVLLTAPKNGFFYVIDRENGRLISAENYVPVTWAKEIDLTTGRPVEEPDIRYPDGDSVEIAPSTMGAHTWLPMAYSPKQTIVVIPAIELSSVFHDRGIEANDWERTPGNILDAGAIVSFPLDEEGESSLVALNPANQEEIWRRDTPGYWNGGVVATGGDLVFQGHIDGTFNAFDIQSGETLWSFDAKAPVLAPPITYQVDGDQYVTVLTGMGTSGAYLGPLLERFDLEPATQARRVLTFKLDPDSKASLPPARESKPVHDDPGFVPKPDSAARGEAVYAQYCAVCHGFRAVAVGAAPDLRKSNIILDEAVFASVVADGLFARQGMPGFGELKEGEVEDARQYLRQQSQRLRTTPDRK